MPGSCAVQLAGAGPERYHRDMAAGTLLDREEYIEQVYFFRVFRQRVAMNMAAQEILERIHEEILSTTRLPLAIQFLATELKHSGLLSSGFSRLPHYFTPYQAFVIRQTEKEGQRFSVETGLLILEREAEYRAEQPTQPGLFVYQFEVLSRDRKSTRLNSSHSSISYAVFCLKKKKKKQTPKNNKKIN